MSPDFLSIVMGFSAGIVGPLLASITAMALRPYFSRRRFYWWTALIALFSVSFFWLGVGLPATQSSNDSNHDLRYSLYWGLVSGPGIAEIVLLLGARLTRRKSRTEGFEVIIRK
jgi:hypothetical protein